MLAGVWLERFLLVAPSLWRGEGLPLGLPELLVTAGTANLFVLCCASFLDRVAVLPLSGSEAGTGRRRSGRRLQPVSLET